MLLTASDVKTYMNVTAATFDAILATIVSGVDQEVKRYLGRVAVEPTLIGDGVTSEGHVGDRRTKLVLREYPILNVQSVIVNGQPFTPILPFAPGNVALTTQTTGGSIVGGVTVYVKVTAFGTPQGSTSLQNATPQEGGFINEYSIFVPAGSTNTVTVTFNRIPNVQYYKVYVGTTLGGENQWFQVNPTGAWGGWTAPGTESIVLTALSGGNTGNPPGGGILITGGDYWVADGGMFGMLQRDYGWDLPKASIGWSSAWWDAQGSNLNANPQGAGARVVGPGQENIIVQYQAGYAVGSVELNALKHAAIEWAVNRFRLREKLDVIQDRTQNHMGFYAVDMPESTRHVLSMYKRAGDWQHPRTTARV